MAWTQAQLAAAFNALSPVPATLVAAYKAFDAQTVSQPVDVPVQAVAGYLGANMKLGSFLAWAAAPPAGASAASIAAAAELAFAFMHPQLVPSFAISNPTIAAQMEGALAALVSPGVAAPIAAADQAAILAMGVRTVKVWQPDVHVAHLQMAQKAGLISAAIPVGG